MIYILGSHWTDQDESAQRPFSGGVGHILQGLLAQAGIEREACIFDSVFRFRPPSGRLDSLLTRSKAEALSGYPPFKPGHYLHQSHGIHLQRLHHRIAEAAPALILALGNTALWATARKSGLKKFRGSPLLTPDRERKVLATWAPDSIIRQWNLRPIVFMDFCKAKAEAADPRLVRPRRIIHLEPTLADIEAFYHEHIMPAPFVSCDVETKAGTITEVGYATSPSRCLVIPFWRRAAPDGNYWRTAADERAAWDWVRRINAEKRLIGQNFQYDMQYFSRTVGIPCPQFHGDTMLLHHTLQPELEKGLGFLGSIYTSEPSWKFMRTEHFTLKREDD